MSHRPWALSSPRSRRLGVAAAALSGLVVAGLPTMSAQSAAPADCPEAVPLDEVSGGMAVNGLTVTQGTEPESFSGEVLGVLDDAIAPGLDMIMVRLEGASITDANGDVKNGVWAGMSGSPVYTDDGRLLGAVAYGLSFSPSDVAGVTPAVEMLQLIRDPAANNTGAPATAQRVAIPTAAAADSGLTEEQVSGGFRRLPMPFSLSGGFSDKRLDKIARKFGIKRRLVSGGAAAADEPAPPIVAGGNLVASLSYGDITYAGIGTATAECDGKVVGFGHPMLWSGRSTLSMHNADAIYIQRDNVFGSYKVANPMAPSGRILEDRLAGILGVEGGHVRSTAVTSHVESTEGGSRDGTTVITYRKAIPQLAATHLLANADRVLDKFGGGSADLRWTAKGTRADGSSWKYARTNSFASHRDITFESVYESYRQLAKILHNGFERVRISDVHYKATYDPSYHALKIENAAARIKGEWVSIGRRTDTLEVQAGSELPIRVTMTPSDKTQAPERVRLGVSVPNNGSFGFLTVGNSDSNRFFVEGGQSLGGARAASFDDLLTALAKAPRNDEVTASLFTESRRGGRQSTDSRIVSDVVSGRKFVEVQIIH